MSDTSETPRRWPRWLVVSLLANMILVGLLVGFLLQSGPKPRPDGRTPDRFTWAERDSGDRETMSRVFREAFRASETQRAARAEVRVRLAAAVAADPYDADAVRAVFQELREADDSVNEATHEAMVELFATLSVEDREHMARVLTRGPGDHRSERRSRPGERGAPGEGIGGPPPLDGPPPPPPQGDMQP